MRFTLSLLIFLSTLVPGQLFAQSRTAIDVSRLRLGLPAGSFSENIDTIEGGYQGVFKAGVFAPVFVDLNAFETFNEPLELVVETADADNAITSISVPLTPMQKGDSKKGFELGRLPYIKVASGYPEISAYVRTAKGGKTVSNTAKRNFNARENSDFLIVALGSNLGSFRLPRLGGLEPNDLEYKRHHGGAVETAACSEIGQLPDHWIGYSAFDLMVLCTGELDKFWTDLKAYPVKQQAIVEWVRRGGKVVVSVGFNLDLVNDLPLFKEILPVTLPPESRQGVESLPLLWVVTKLNSTKSYELRDTKAAGKIFTVDFQRRADREFRSISPPENTRRDAKPIIVQGTYGLGRVTVVAFDLDRAPFTDWANRDVFWHWLATEAGGRLPEIDERFGRSDREDPQFVMLNDMLDSFEGVPVISFGWVAVFILLYLLLIGPIDYFFLKKVIKRLEWTWVTFPLIVITVSALAYYAAYAVKGNEQKINKIDFVDVDLQTKRMYGHTWFTIFSPRIQNYNVGVEPAGPQPGDRPDKPTWTGDDAAKTAPDTVLSWNSQLREQGRSLIQRRYRYHTDYTNGDRPQIANGMLEVPIQVWSTKSFEATWSAGLNPQLPLLTHTLRHPPGEPDKLIGSVISNLPVPVLSDVRVFYRDRSINLGELIPGDPKEVTFKDTDPPINNALGSIGNYDMQIGLNRQSGPGMRGDSFGAFRLWGILFGDRLGNADRPMSHTTLRNLDHSWRVRETSLDQAILVIRLPATKGDAEVQSQDPASSTRLWLTELPGGDAPRTRIQGTMRQETYVRFFIPIPRTTPSDKK